MAYADKSALDELNRRLALGRGAASAIREKRIPVDAIDFNWLVFGDPTLASKLDQLLDIKSIKAFDDCIDHAKRELRSLLKSLPMQVLLHPSARDGMRTNIKERLAARRQLRSTKVVKNEDGTPSPRGRAAAETQEKHLYALTGPLEELQTHFQQKVIYLAMGRLMAEILAADPTSGISDRTEKFREKYAETAEKQIGKIIAALNGKGPAAAASPAQMLVDKGHGSRGTTRKARSVESGAVANDSAEKVDPSIVISEPEDHSLNLGDANADTEKHRSRAGANDDPGAEIDHSVRDATAGKPDVVAAANNAPAPVASDETTSELPRSEDRGSRPSAAIAAIDWEKVILAHLEVHQDGVPSNAGSLGVPAIEAARFFTGASNATETGSDMRRWTLAHIMEVLGLPRVGIAIRGITTPEPEEGFFDLLFQWKLVAQQSTLRIFELEEPDQWVSRLPVPDNWKKLIAVLKRRRSSWGYGPFHEQLSKKGWRPLTYSWDPWLGYSPRQLELAQYGLGLADFHEAVAAGRSLKELAQTGRRKWNFYATLLNAEGTTGVATPLWFRLREHGLKENVSRVSEFELRPSDRPVDEEIIEAARRRWRALLVEGELEPAVI